MYSIVANLVSIIKFVSQLGVNHFHGYNIKQTGYRLLPTFERKTVSVPFCEC